MNQVPLVLHLQQDQRQRNWRSQISLEPGASGSVEFKLPELTEGRWQGYVMVEADDELPFDNRCHTAMLVAPPMEVLTIDGDPTDSPVTSETYFLEAALRWHRPASPLRKAPIHPAWWRARMARLCRSSGGRRSWCWPTWPACRRPIRGDWPGSSRPAAAC